jgi:acyl-lipid omega-6 desaturase (Delta-12 desaturase)
MTNLNKDGASTEKMRWQEVIAPYRNPAIRRSVWQLANTFIPFFVTWYLMYLSLGYSYWLTLGLAPLTAGFQLRLFILFHDCGHQSFFKSQKANDIIGSICGFFCFTPYYHWRYIHAMHHATVGNLGRRIEGELLPLTIKKYGQNNGDILTLTVKEYRQLSGWEKLIYRFYRNPAVLFLIMPPLLFLVLHRFANPTATKRARHSVYWTNLALLGLGLLLVFTIGLGPLLLIELPVVFLAACAGVWLFYIQHQFEATYWEQGGRWNFVAAAIQGSSYYKLPKLLQWFTGNIGFHHIHHLNPKIPNYYLQKCHNSSPLFNQSVEIGLGLSMKSIFLRLWDEDQQKMVGFAG